MDIIFLFIYAIFTQSQNHWILKFTVTGGQSRIARIAFIKDLAKQGNQTAKIIQLSKQFILDIMNSSAGRSPWLYLSMFVSEICEQT